MVGLGTEGLWLACAAAAAGGVRPRLEEGCFRDIFLGAVAEVEDAGFEGERSRCAAGVEWRMPGFETFAVVVGARWGNGKWEMPVRDKLGHCSVGHAGVAVVENAV